MSIRNILMTAGAASQAGGGIDNTTPYLLALSNDNRFKPNATLVDAKGNMYFAGWMRDYVVNPDNTTYGSYILKLNSMGGVLWSVYLPETSTDPNYYWYLEPYSMCVSKDKAELYVASYAEDNNNWYISFMSFNITTGALLMQKTYGSQAGEWISGGYPLDICIDTAGDIFMVGNTSVLSGADPGFVYKISKTSGNIIWAKHLENSTYYLEMDAIQYDPVSTDIFITGQAYNTYDCPHVARLSSVTGDTVWATEFIVTNTRAQPYGLSLDSNLNVYIVIECRDSQDWSSIGVAVLDQNGNFIRGNVYQRDYGESRADISDPRICIDTKTNEIYAVGDTYAYPYERLLMYKLSLTLDVVDCMEIAGDFDGFNWGTKNLWVDKNSTVYCLFPSYTLLPAPYNRWATIPTVAKMSSDFTLIKDKQYYLFENNAFPMFPSTVVPVVETMITTSPESNTTVYITPTLVEGLSDFYTIATPTIHVYKVFL